MGLDPIRHRFWRLCAMFETELNHRMTAMDAFFLYAERDEAPMHVGCTCIFDGPLPFKKFMKNLEARIHLIPRYTQRAVPAPFNIGHPTWEFDPDFEITNHLFEIKTDELEMEKNDAGLPHGTSSNENTVHPFFVDAQSDSAQTVAPRESNGSTCDCDTIGKNSTFIPFSIFAFFMNH